MNKPLRSDWLRILIPILFLVGTNVTPESARVLEDLQEARLAEAGGQGHLAAVKLRDVLNQRTWDTRLWERVGLDELAGGYAKEGQQALETAAQLGKISNNGLSELGQSYQQQGNLTAALAVWKRLAVGDGSSKTLEKLATVEQMLGKNEDAVQTLKAWRKQDPSNAAAAYQLGLLLVVGQPDEGLKQLEAAAQLDAHYQTAADEIQKADGLATLNTDKGYQLVVYGRALANLGVWNLAKEAFQKATVVSPDYAEGWAFLGEAQIQTGEGGVNALNQAVKINPQSVIGHTMLALYWSRQEKWDAAIAQIQVVIQLEPERAEWQMELGNLTAMKGDLNSALVEYQKATEMDPKNVQVWQGLASFSQYFHTAERETGLPAARQAVALESGNAESLDLMGKILMDLGDISSAERFFDEAAQADPNSAAVQLHLGQLYLQTMDEQKALAHLEKAHSLDQKGQTGMMAQRLLERYFGKSGG